MKNHHSSHLSCQSPVLKHYVLDVFEERADELNLVRDIKADYFSRLTTARAGNLTLVDAMFDLTSFKTRWRGATATPSFFRNYIQSIFLCIKLIFSLEMNSFRGSSSDGTKSSVRGGSIGR